jgi:hypothetical protein
VLIPPRQYCRRGNVKALSQIVSLTILLLSAVSGIAADKVVVIPLGGKKPSGTVIATEVLEGTTFSNDDGVDIQGTMVDRGAITYLPGTSSQTIARGYHNGSGLVTGDPNLVSSNIKSGVTLFSITGDTNVVDTTSGNITAGDLLSGKKAWAKGVEITGNIPTQNLSDASETVDAGFYNATTLSTVDTDLQAPNIKSGITLFGVAGSYEMKSAPVQITGQTTPYATNDDGHLEKGVQWPVPRFTNNEDETVTDNLTGLMWQRSVGLEDRKGLWADAITECNLATTGGLAEWRLPNVRELLSVISFGADSPALLASHPFINVVHGNYWTSTTLAGNIAQAWFVFLGTGRVLDATKTASQLYIWCVRDE